MLLSKIAKQTAASVSFPDADTEGIPLTFSFGTTANITSTSQFLFGKVGQDKKDDALAFMDASAALIDVSQAALLGATAANSRLVTFA